MAEASIETNEDFIPKKNQDDGIESIPDLQHFMGDRTCFSRWFGKMEPGSVRGSMLALTVTAIGGGWLFFPLTISVGVLSLPYVCKLCGLVFGLIMLMLGYLAASWSYSMIIKADVRGGGLKSYRQFCEATGGRKLMVFYNFIVIFTIYGTLIGYQVIVASMFQRIMKNFGVTNPEDYRAYHIMGVSLFIIFPICLLRGVSNLRYATILSIFSITYTTVIVIIELPFYWTRGIATVENIVWFKLDWSFFSAFGITFFAFMSQTGFYAAIERLTKRDPPHLTKITIRAVTINLGYYFIITLAGYLSTLEKTKDLIIDRDSPFGEDTTDIPMTISQMMICCSLCIGIPLNFVPVRTAVFEQVFESAQYTFPRGLIASVIFAASTCVFTIYLPGISTVLGIVGGIGCVALAYIIPLLAYLKTHPEKVVQGYLYILIAALLVAVGSGAAINSILQFI